MAQHSQSSVSLNSRDTQAVGTALGPDLAQPSSSSPLSFLPSTHRAFCAPGTQRASRMLRGGLEVRRLFSQENQAIPELKVAKVSSPS